MRFSGRVREHNVPIKDIYENEERKFVENDRKTKKINSTSVANLRVRSRTRHIFAGFLPRTTSVSRALTSYKVIFAEFCHFDAVSIEFIARIGGLALSLAVMVDFAGFLHLLSFGV